MPHQACLAVLLGQFTKERHNFDGHVHATNERFPMTHIDPIPDLTWYVFKRAGVPTGHIKSHTGAGHHWMTQIQADPRIKADPYYWGTSDSLLCDPNRLISLRNDARTEGLRVALAPTCDDCTKPAEDFYYGQPLCLSHLHDAMGFFDDDDDPHHYLDPDDDIGHMLLDV